MKALPSTAPLMPGRFCLTAAPWSLALAACLLLAEPLTAASDGAKAADVKAKAAIQTGEDTAAVDEAEDEAVEADSVLALEQDPSDTPDDDLAPTSDGQAEQAAAAYLEQSLNQPGAPGTAGQAPRTEKVTVNLPPASRTTPSAPARSPAPRSLPAPPTSGRSAAALSGSQITAVQQALNAAGAQLSIDGQMGLRTRVALTDFQRQHGLPASGDLTPATLEKLGVRR